MGAGSSTFCHDLRTPTRSLHSKLDLQAKSASFTFSQEMKKGVGEDQLLISRVIYSGKMEEISQEVDYKGRIIKGNPVYLLHTEQVSFEVEWGNEWYQSKKGKLIREDLMERKERKKKCTPIITSSSPPPLSPSVSSSSHLSTLPLPLPVFSSVALPPAAADSLSRGFSHSAPLSPAPLSLCERQRSHVDAETGGGETPVQSITLLDKDKTSSLTSSPIPSLSSPLSTSPSTPPPPSSSSSSSSSSSFHRPSLPRSITITHHGAYHTQLQNSSSLEEMIELLQLDLSDWQGTFSPSALPMRVELMSEEVRVEYWRLKLEFLWAQIQDECPIIMALSNIFHDPTCHELYMPRGQA